MYDHNKGLKFEVKMDGIKPFTVWEKDIVLGVFKDSVDDWMNKNYAIIDCYAMLKTMQEDEMKKNGHKIQSLQGTWAGYNISIHEMSADIILDSRGNVEIVDSRDMKPY
jgi:hypothetical protein